MRVDWLFHTCVDQILLLDPERALDGIDAAGKRATALRIPVSRTLHLPRSQHDIHFGQNGTRFVEAGVHHPFWAGWSTVWPRLKFPLVAVRV